MAAIHTPDTPPKHILFAFEIAAYAGRYDVTVNHWRVPLDMRVKDAHRVHERSCREAFHEFTGCRDVPKMAECDEAAADRQFETDQLDQAMYGW